MFSLVSWLFVKRHFLRHGNLIMSHRGTYFSFLILLVVIVCLLWITFIWYQCWTHLGFFQKYRAWSYLIPSLGCFNLLISVWPLKNICCIYSPRKNLWNLWLRFLINLSKRCRIWDNFFINLRVIINIGSSQRTSFLKLLFIRGINYLYLIITWLIKRWL